MVQKIAVTLQDDIDGGIADETVRFAFGGAAYEIDLSDQHAADFRAQIVPFVEHARKAQSGQTHRAARTASSRQRSQAVRAWAKAQGLSVSDRGRIPAQIAERYDGAHKG